MAREQRGAAPTKPTEAVRLADTPQLVVLAAGATKPPDGTPPGLVIRLK